MTSFTLDDLAKIIADRASADGAESYTAKLLASGTPRIARKFGEEAVEAVVAALTEDDAALTGEAADVLYHLLVMLQSRGIKVSDVMAELEKRTGRSGLAEKAARRKGGAD